MKNVVLNGDCLEEIKNMHADSIDAVVTDPPYGLGKEPDITEVLTKWLAGEDYEHRGGGFMGKSWDSFVPGPSVWKEVFRILKPGGHVLCFAGTRTQDLMTISLRLAGFEVRDVIEWLYFSGFPKSMDVGKAFDKRAGAEREVIGQKLTAYDGSVRKPNFNHNKTWDPVSGSKYNGFGTPITLPATDLAQKWDGWGTALKPAHEPIILCRKPLGGTVCDTAERYGTGAINVDGCRIEFTDPNEDTRRNSRGGENGLTGTPTFKIRERKVEDFKKPEGRFPANCITLEDGQFYSKYFNVTTQELSKKASKKDRSRDWRGKKTYNRNTHPTVKPIDLMAWLVRLITPPGGIVFDPFAGSGSTLVAAKREGFYYVGIEREEEYVEITRARLGEQGE
ncbi:DNA-methyltransferase [Paludifilum halophilum]|uniref:Methyltransferase n=1 Tax=Paludifilum halophilum TaxID=1642702 RepID=A0A235B8B6_9BACL|nr:site-specific DNA-methyltransferase [Paludifilum halophilum]OYD08563.1 hypothetical protein CHM34_06980 [Paludifilum halophilum]